MVELCDICGDASYADLVFTCSWCTSSRAHNQLCDICGSGSNAELFVTCSKCEVVCEHLYCMPIKTHDAPKSWLCGNCELVEAKSPDDPGLQVQPRVQRHAKTSKVKFIPTEEVIKLSSAGMNGPSKSNTAFAPRRTSISRKVPASSIPRPLFLASKERQERSSTMMPPKVCGVKKQTFSACLPPMYVGPVQTSKKVKGTTDIPACSSSVPRPGLPVMNTGKIAPSASTKLEDMQKQMTDALRKKELYTYREYLPSLHASWKGGFRFVDAVMAGKFYGDFLAKPPCIVHARAYELSQKIPSVLQVNLLNRSVIWDDLFHGDCPDLADIALYFFPSDNIERSRKNNSCLFELMEREELLIRSLIDGAELVIFTSRQLDDNSQYVINRLNAECLLFGIFRNVKVSHSRSDILGGECTAVVPSLEYGSRAPSVECASRVPLLECTSSGHGKNDDSNAVNKEIEIISQNTIGKSSAASEDVDSTIERLLLEFGSQQPGESDVNALTKNVKIEHQEPAPISAIGSYAYSLSLSKVNTASLPVAEVKGSDDKKCSRAASTSNVDGSRNRIGLFDETISKSRTRKEPY